MSAPRLSADTLALQRLYHWEQDAPTRVALRQPMGGSRVQDFSWGELGDQVRRMAAHLKTLGLEQGWEPGARIAILSKNCAWWLMSDLAIWMAGYVSVPLYPTLAADTVSQILTHSEAKLLFVGKLDGWDGMKAGVPASLPCISYPVSPEETLDDYDTWDAICYGTDPLKGNPTRGADELATIIYTSGTTGMPKGVMHTFGSFAWAIQSGLKRVPLSEDDRMLSYLPLAHVVERVLVEHGWLRTGMLVFFAESLETFAADLQRARPTVFFSVPRLWTKFQQGVHAKLPPRKFDLLTRLPIIGGLVRRKILKALGLDQCRLAAGGAAPMPVALLKWYRELGLPINEGYGMTENLAVSHITVPGKDQTGSVGPAYDGVQTRLDPITGELQMKSPALMLGYYKQAELTQETLTADGWLHTGDKAEISDKGALAGCVRITGRVKDLFKTSKGKYVSPAPIEDRLAMNPALEACAVTGANLAQPIGIAMLSPEAVRRAAQPGTREQLVAELERHLQAVNAKLDPHEQLDCLVAVSAPWTVDNGLITPTFKVRRNRIDELYGPRIDGWLAQRRKVLLVD
ncbi:AMP-binding protein [Roseateles amylovorans]|uniref:AMP-binding protein n=1 Tax=Roseateles amylovorans TaxID=2978473 RepID=A0ABY6B281_9BURK|nr:AMP-binding protein [Roseateles amylovorans]UXH78321.1 AMP-binding protein [Roseateles amylovorans]